MIEAALADPDPSESSLGSWADECERADAALAATEAQMGRKGERQEDNTSLAAAEAQMEKEDRELLVTLEAAMAPLRPCQAGPEGRPPSKKRDALQKQRPQLHNGGLRTRRQRKVCQQLSRGIRQRKGPPIGTALAAPAAPGGRKTRSRWWECDREGSPFPLGLRRDSTTETTRGETQCPCWPARAG